MRKIFCILSAAAFLLCGCGVPSPHGDIEMREADSVILETQYPVYAPDVEQIGVTIRNDTDERIEYGAEWSLEMKRGGVWVTLPFKENVGWIGIAYLLEAGGSSAFTINTGILKKPLAEGCYRVVKSIGGVAYAGEFSIGDSSITAAATHGYLPIGGLPADYSVVDAEADGVIFDDGAAAIDRFFAHLGVGHDTQLRLGRDEGGLVLTDILAEHVNGSLRIKYSVDLTRAGGGKSETYYSHFVVNNAQIALSNFVDGDEKQVVLPLPAVTELAIVTVYRMQESAKEWSVNRAGFWSPDGMKLITLRENSTEFGLSVCYPDGGSMGTTLTLDAKYGITAIKDVLWRADSETVMLAGDGDDCMILVPYHISDGRFDDSYSVPND